MVDRGPFTCLVGCKNGLQFLYDLSPFDRLEEHTIAVTSISNKIRDISAFFNKRIEEFGATPVGCDYHSWDTQQLRFDVMAGVYDLNGRSILDVGCGFGDFYAYLNKHWVDNFSYRGVDISERMIDEGRQRNPDAEIQVLDILENDLPVADVVVANGIFYLLGDDGWPHMQVLIRRLFDLSNKAVAFSSLSTYATKKSEGEFQCDPSVAFTFCKSLTSHVTLRHDYHPGDFTIYMYRDTAS